MAIEAAGPQPWWPWSGAVDDPWQAGPGPASVDDAAIPNGNNEEPVSEEEPLTTASSMPELIGDDPYDFTAERYPNIEEPPHARVQALRELALNQEARADAPALAGFDLPGVDGSYADSEVSTAASLADFARVDPHDEVN